MTEHNTDTTDTDQLMPTTVIETLKTDVATRINDARLLQQGDNTPADMDTYLAGYIDAHRELKSRLKRVESRVEEFDHELCDLRQPTCYQCGTTLPPDWDSEPEHTDDDNPATCPDCGDIPLPPVGATDTD